MRQLVIDKIIELTTPDRILRNFIGNHGGPGKDAELWLQNYHDQLNLYTDAQLVNLYTATILLKGRTGR